MNNPSLSHQAYRKIKRQIVSLQLAPGSVIDEARLREDLNLGRTPIREALLRLSLEKLVVIVPRRGMFVSDIGLTSLQQLLEVRVVTEGMAARYAAQRGTEAQWQEMQEILDSALDAEDGVVPNELLMEIDEACHQIIYDAADNEFLTDILITNYALSQRLWQYFLNKIQYMRSAIMEHQLILEALIARDDSRAASLMERHINTFQEELQSVILGSYERVTN